MQNNLTFLKEKLANALDNEYNVVDHAAVSEVFSDLEKMDISNEILITTRLGQLVNQTRRKCTDKMLAQRAKNLLRLWREMLGLHNDESNFKKEIVFTSEPRTKSWILEKTVDENGPCCINKTDSASNISKTSPIVARTVRPPNGSINFSVTLEAHPAFRKYCGSSEICMKSNCVGREVDINDYECKSSGDLKIKLRRKRTLTSGSSIQIINQSICRPRVKTTQELVYNMIEKSTANYSAEDLEDMKVPYLKTFKNSSSVILLNNDEADIRNVDTSALDIASEVEPLDGTDKSVTGQNTTHDTVEKIIMENMSRLPPIDYSQISDEVSIEPESDSEINNNKILFVIGTENIEEVTGNYDDGVIHDENDSGFREWHEPISRKTSHGRVLHILPYVVLD